MKRLTDTLEKSLDKKRVFGQHVQKNSLQQIFLDIVIICFTYYLCYILKQLKL